MAKFYTSYFGNISKIKKHHPNMSLISICRFPPKFFTVNYKLQYLDLAPTVEMMKNVWDQKKTGEPIDHTPYINEFNKILINLDQQTVVNELIEMSGNNDEVCLMCFEPVGKFCHRHLVADWLNTYLPNHEKCEELDIDEESPNEKLF